MLLKIFQGPALVDLLRRIERRNVGVGRLALQKRRAGDLQAVMMNRVEYPLAGDGRVSGEQYHLDRALLRELLVNAQKPPHEREGHALAQRLVQMGLLILPVRLLPLLAEYAV